MFQSREKAQGISFPGALSVIDLLAHEQAIVAFPTPRRPGRQFDQCICRCVCF